VAANSIATPGDCRDISKAHAKLASMKGTLKHHSAGIVVVRRVAGEWKYLILRAYRNWDFPKGRIESGESPLVAARRETREETGLTDIHFHWGHDCIDTEMYGDHKIATYFLAETTQMDIALPMNPELGHPEHNEYRWASAEEAQRLLPARLQPVLIWAGQILAACV
jgi:8-oxo-dGTP pyrophosphatase MutT (NUDIX family)